MLRNNSARYGNIALHEKIVNTHDNSTVKPKSIYDEKLFKSTLGGHKPFNQVL